MGRKAWVDRMFLVEEEYRAAMVATSLLRERLRADPGFLTAYQLTRSHLLRLAGDLGLTCIVRLFAEFETGLRDAWERSFDRTTRPKMEDLLRSVASRRAISHEVLRAADEVRLYRNALVHERATGATWPIAIGEVRDRLCRYFSRLPPTW